MTAIQTRGSEGWQHGSSLTFTKCAAAFECRLEASGRHEDKDTSNSGEDFAEKILSLELELQEKCSLDLIHALMDVYTVSTMQRAIEHYEWNQDQKYLKLQERMHAFLLRKDVMSVLRSVAPRKAHSTLPSPRHASFHSPKRTCEHHKSLSIQLQAQLTTQRKHESPESLIDSAQSEAFTTVSNVHEDLKTQHAQLQERLERRKQRFLSLRCSPVWSEGHDDGGSDVSTEVPTPRPAYDAEYEALIERLEEKRTRLKAELEEKYQSQANELLSYSNEGENSLIAKVVEELWRARDRELASLEQELAGERAQAVCELRSAYGKPPLS